MGAGDLPIGLEHSEPGQSSLSVVKLLVAGVGSIGRRHLRNLRQIGAGDLLVYRTTRRPAPELDGTIGVFGSLEEALEQKPDAVFITNPTSLHVPTALTAARRGCHLFIEKPLSHSLDGVAELAETVENAGLVVLVGCNLRFHPLLRRARELLCDGAIGRVTGARLEVGEYLPDWHPGENYRTGYSARRDLGGGVILTLIHELDYAYWLFGDVEHVYAVAGRQSGLEIDVEDTADILLGSRAGVTINIHMDYIQRPPTRTLQVTGEGGTLRWDYHRGQLAVYSVRTKAWQEWSDPPGFERNQMFLDEVSHFLECLAGRARPLIPLQEGRRVLEVALAAKRSTESGERVSLPAAA